MSRQQLVSALQTTKDGSDSCKGCAEGGEMAPMIGAYKVKEIIPRAVLPCCGDLKDALEASYRSQSQLQDLVEICASSVIRGACQHMGCALSSNWLTYFA